MDVLIQFIGSAGYPTSFVAAAVFFIFWHQKMLKSVQEQKDAEFQRLQEDNRTLRAERNEQDDEIDVIKEKLWRSEARLDILQGNYPMKEGKDNGRQGNTSGHETEGH